MSPACAVARRLLLGVLLLAGVARAQEFDFDAPPTGSDGTAASIRDLAGRVIPVYENKDEQRYLSSLSLLQLAAGDIGAAVETRRSLADHLKNRKLQPPDGHGITIDLFARAELIKQQKGASFDTALAGAFDQVVAPLGDLAALSAKRQLLLPPSHFKDDFQAALDRVRGHRRIDLDTALQLVRSYVVYDAYRGIGPAIAALEQSDEARRYQSDGDVAIHRAPGVTIYARWIRPRSGAAKLPALLRFTIDANDNDALIMAAHGYAGVVAYTRGVKPGIQATSRSALAVPFQYDGDDARAVIDWIAKQPWSDGRVGMIGERYSGFAAWAVLRHPPSALKAVATFDPMAPGIDFPTQGRVFHNAALQWIIEHTQSDKPFANDDAYWQKVDRKWYRSGRRYRDLDRIADAPSRFFLRWLNHPSYDRFWRVLIPFGDEFKHIDVPLLTITGYYSAGEPAALYYWTESRKHEANGEHTLLIGPYDDSAFATAPGETVRGLPLDSAARLDLTELRYQWLDHIFKTAAQPALLKNGIDYELEGANNWGNATSLQAMANGSLRLYLRPGKNAAHRLSSKSTRPPSHVSQVVRLRDRSDADADWSTPPLLGSQIDLRNSVRWIGEPLKQPLAVAGRLKIALDFKPNKQDVDIRFALYELRPDGRYVTLSEPEDQRASYARDRIHRHLLKAGERQRLEITSQRLMARQVQAGSRLVFTLGVTKRPDREINYGAGKDVSEESVADAGAPLKILWYGDSSIELPVQR